MREPTREEILEETVNAARENRAPDFSRFRDPAAPSGESDAFGSDDLAEPEGRVYPVPGTSKRLWVYPIAPDDYELMLEWSLLWGGGEKDGGAGEKDVVNAALRSQKLAMQMAVFQVILCCRKGPAKSAERCFTIKDAPKLRKLLGITVIKEIARISSDMSGNEEQLTPGVRRFFTVVLGCLATWYSASSTWDGCPDGLRDTTARLQSLVSLALSQGRLASGILSELEEG